MGIVIIGVWLVDYLFCVLRVLSLVHGCDIGFVTYSYMYTYEHSTTEFD